MKRFIIKCDTSWAGGEVEYKVEAKSENELYDLAEDLAYKNFKKHDYWASIAEMEGYDPDEMADKDWEELYKTTDESNYYSYVIEPFEGSEEEWKETI